MGCSCRVPLEPANTHVPLFCNFYSFVLLEDDLAPCSWAWAVTSVFWCLHLRIGGGSNSEINEMKVSPFFISLLYCRALAQSPAWQICWCQSRTLAPENTSAPPYPGNPDIPQNHRCLRQAQVIRKLIQPLARLIIVTSLWLNRKLIPYLILSQKKKKKIRRKQEKIFQS